MTRNLAVSEARQLAEEAYVYGYAIVENYKAMFGMAIYKDSPVYGGFNHFRHSRELWDPDYTTVVSANNDTLYSTGFADLRAEPIVISVPPTGDRYFSIQLIDMTTDNFAYIGTRATGKDGGDFVLVGPAFKGAIPTGQFNQVIVSPSHMVGLAIRTAIDGPEELASVMEIQDKLIITPFSRFLNTPAPDAPPEIQYPPYTSALQGSPKLFEYLNLLLRWHTPSVPEVPLMKRLARINVGSNLEFVLDEFTAEIQEAIRAGAAAAHQRIEERGNNLGTTIEGWDYPPPMGDYGDDYLFRSAVAWKFIYTNSSEEALYPVANVDGDGLPLSGSKNYVLHFHPGQLPPVEAFWSITMYSGDTRLMVHNPIDRYSIGNRTKGLKYNDDGSLTLYFQHEAPGEGKDPNWLSAPAGSFYVIARAYIPEEPMLNGTYRLPSLQSV